MSEPRCYPTGYAGLWYRNDGEHQKKARWSYVRASDRASIGAAYPSKIDLLADLANFAASIRVTKEDVRQNPADVFRAEVETPEPVATVRAADAPEPGATAQTIWREFWAQAKPEGWEVALGTPETASHARHVHNEARRMFFAGFWAMLQVCYRVGEEDVSSDAGFTWIENLRREVRPIHRT